MHVRMVSVLTWTILTNASVYHCLITSQVPFVCIHGANDTIALPASSQFIYDHTATAKELKKVHFFADSKHEPFHESAAIRTASIEYVVNYFEEQYQIALNPSKAPTPAAAVEAKSGQVVAVAAQGENKSEEVTLGAEDAVDASAAAVSAANERSTEPVRTIEPLEVEK